MYWFAKDNIQKKYYYGNVNNAQSFLKVFVIFLLVSGAVFIEIKFQKNILNIYKSGKSADFPDLIFHKRGRNGQLNLLLVPFGNSCAVVCETIPATNPFCENVF